MERSAPPLLPGGRWSSCALGLTRHDALLVLAAEPLVMLYSQEDVERKVEFLVETVGFEVGCLLALVLWERGEERQRTSSSRRSLSAPAAAWVGTGKGGQESRTIASAPAPGEPTLGGAMR
ncbi:unnamed protein product [Miscanthus lutarioriparius]|uniref:Uncharacterized protein n=1 Tax=Miscanthus lutarioriparius TaxID=422564 RepID=A0A811QBD0_9POAL|nr:unnamed protein product [Miscanthus lutarioriparius]